VDRKPFDVVLMFKVLVLQTLYDLADERLEYLIWDQLSFASAPKKTWMGVAR